MHLETKLQKDKFGEFGWRRARFSSFHLKRYYKKFNRMHTVKKIGWNKSKGLWKVHFSEPEEETVRELLEKILNIHWFFPSEIWPTVFFEHEWNLFVSFADTAFESYKQTFQVIIFFTKNFHFKKFSDFDRKILSKFLKTAIHVCRGTSLWTILLWSKLQSFSDFGQVLFCREISFKKIGFFNQKNRRWTNRIS